MQHALGVTFCDDFSFISVVHNISTKSLMYNITPIDHYNYYFMYNYYKNGDMMFGH